MDLQAEVQRIIDAETDDFVELLGIAGLSPKEDLEGLDLSGVDLSQKTLKDWNLAFCNLDGADLRDTTLVNTTLTGADLRRALYHESIRSVAILAGAILDEVKDDSIEALQKKVNQLSHPVAVAYDTPYQEMVSNILDLFSQNFDSRFALWKSAREVAEPIAYQWWSLQHTAPTAGFFYRWLSSPEATAGDFEMIHRMQLPMYMEQISNLAHCMWSAHGQSPSILPLDFYIAAERHISLVLAGTIKSSPNVEIARHRVLDVFQKFSAQKYLNGIRTGAYFGWLKRGCILWDSLRDWLVAETDVMKRLMDGDIEPALV